LTVDEHAALTRRGVRWTVRGAGRGLTTSEADDLGTALAAGETAHQITTRLHQRLFTLNLGLRLGCRHADALQVS
jgi:hypothetical protein